ncbi:hypothetical protein [Rhizobium sp. L1K21]|uniref:hypothetical protein n=1 Tax=Rhizobium sp. L1K21 TaxID=2954933 RepID=UPI002092ED36|nr:hypothetical protein [Rhizobium sp. L1K21]MCO6186913.1 hypothetical protein [Rhizobium sp. L1K21]
MRISDSLATRILGKLAEMTHLKKGDRSRLEALNRIRDLSGLLPEDWRFDREEANLRR